MSAEEFAEQIFDHDASSKDADETVDMNTKMFSESSIKQEQFDDYEDPVVINILPPDFTVTSETRAYPVKLVTSAYKRRLDQSTFRIKESKKDSLIVNNDGERRDELLSCTQVYSTDADDTICGTKILSLNSNAVPENTCAADDDSVDARTDHRRKSRRKSTPKRINKNKCDICNKFVSKKDLNSHRISCSNNFRCHVCLEEFSNEKNYREHLNMYDKNDVVVCLKCGKLFHNKSSLTSHKRVHSEAKTTFKCCLCDAQFESKNSFQTHVKTHGVEKPFECSDCGNKYALYDSLVRHARVHDVSKAYKCQECGKHFAEQVAYKRHLTIHTGEKPYKCSSCGQGFRDPSTLRKHEKRHGTERPFVCEHCGKSFASNYDLRKHLKTHIDQAEREFQCGECGKGFYLRAALTTHIRTHTKEKPFKCEICNKSYADQSNLHAHGKTHRNDESLQCDLCGLVFKWRCNLIRHLKIVHFKEKLYKCPVPQCGKEFGQQVTLSYHIRVHSGEKPFSCDKCGKKFADRTSLVRHEVTHTKTTPFKCEVCGRSYRGKFLLRRHMNRHIKKMFGSGLKPKHRKEAAFLDEKLVSQYKVIVEHADDGTYLTRIVKKKDENDSNFEDIEHDDSNFTEELADEDGDLLEDLGDDNYDNEETDESVSEKFGDDNEEEMHLEDFDVTNDADTEIIVEEDYNDISDEIDEKK